MSITYTLSPSWAPRGTTACSRSMNCASVISPPCEHYCRITDTDANFNAILDSVTFSAQQTDRAYGRTAADEDVLAIMNPTPGQTNP